jgi:hypothetical protein
LKNWCNKIIIKILLPAGREAAVAVDVDVDVDVDF